VEFVEPTGAFYFFFRVDGVTPSHDCSGTAFCEAAMSAGVALVPGAAFGDDRWVRMSYAAGDKDLETALDRILGLIARLGEGEKAAAGGRQATVVS
jgi:aspartate/methionine/tyrosine aminotransferase